MRKILKLKFIELEKHKGGWKYGIRQASLETLRIAKVTNIYAGRCLLKYINLTPRRKQYIQSEASCQQETIRKLDRKSNIAQ